MLVSISYVSILFTYLYCFSFFFWSVVYFFVCYAVVDIRWDKAERGFRDSRHHVAGGKSARGVCWVSRSSKDSNGSGWFFWGNTFDGTNWWYYRIFDPFQLPFLLGDNTAFWDKMKDVHRSRPQSWPISHYPVHTGILGKENHIILRFPEIWVSLNHPLK